MSGGAVVWLGLDLGTSSVRALLLDDTGRVTGTTARTYAIDSPRPGWAEQDPAAWWAATVAAVREVMERTATPPEALTGIGLTGQMHGLVIVDDRGRVLRPAIPWPDRRSAAEVSSVCATLGADEVRAISGMAPSTGLLGPSLAWVRRHEPDVYAAAAAVMLPKDHLRQRLTGQIATEPSDACGALLLDVHRGQWSEALVDALGIDVRLLPPVVASTDVVGGLTADAAIELGLRSGTPVLAGGGDQATSALALGLDSPGDTSVAVSSGGTIVQATDVPPPSPPPGVHVLRSASGGLLLMGAVLTAGLALQWLARALDRPVAEVAAGAEAVPPCAGGLLFLPHLAGERTPHLDPDARGCFVGLTLEHGAGHLARAVMEGVAMALTDALDAVAAAGRRPAGLVAGGGGLRNPLWRQILADSTGVPVAVTDVEEHSATGAALLAARALGAPGLELARGAVRDPARPSTPSPYAGWLETYRRAFRDLSPTMHAAASRSRGGSLP